MGRGITFLLIGVVLAMGCKAPVDKAANADLNGGTVQSEDARAATPPRQLKVNPNANMPDAGSKSTN